MTEANITNLDAFLDIHLDEIPDLPSFLTIPNGAHLVKLMVPKIDHDKGTISITGTYIGTEELDNADDSAKLPSGAGGFIGETFRPGKENPQAGVQRIKMLFKDIADARGWMSVRDILNGIEGMEVIFVTKLRAGKKDEATGETPLFVGVKAVIDPDTYKALKGSAEGGVAQPA